MWVKNKPQYASPARCFQGDQSCTTAGQDGSHSLQEPRSDALPRLGISPGNAVEGAAEGNPFHPSSQPTRAEAALERRQHRAALSCASPAGLFLEGRAVVGEPLLAQRTDADYFKPYC